MGDPSPGVNPASAASAAAAPCRSAAYWRADRMPGKCPRVRRRAAFPVCPRAHPWGGCAGRRHRRRAWSEPCPWSSPAPQAGFRNKTNYRHEGSIDPVKPLSLLAVQIRHLPEGERRVLARLQHEAGGTHRRGYTRWTVHLRHELVRGLRIEIVDVVAEMDRAVRACPAGEVNPRHWDRPRQLDRRAPARRDL